MTKLLQTRSRVSGAGIGIEELNRGRYVGQTA